MDLRVECEPELVESYNRRDNVRIIGLPKETTPEGNRTLEFMPFIKVRPLQSRHVEYLLAQDIYICIEIEEHLMRRFLMLVV